MQNSQKSAKPQKTPWIPYYAIIPLLSCFGFNCIIYWGVSAVTGGFKHYDFTLGFDRSVPLVPEFITIYLGCYLFWIVNYLLIAKQGKEYCMRFVVSDLLSRLICGIFFLILPTTNVRPELTGNDLWTELLRFLYQIDSPTRLFPSIHCLVSWFSYIGLRGRKNIPLVYRVFSCIFAILVFVSTQVTKQHYIVDVIGAVVIAELTFYIGFHTDWYRKAAKVYDALTRRVFGRTCFEELERK